jgi:hypothetical protein
MTTVDWPALISVGLDIGKEVLHLVGFGRDGKIVFRRKTQTTVSGAPVWIRLLLARWMTALTDLGQVLLRGGTGGPCRHSSRITNCHPYRRCALSAPSEIALDRKGPLPLSDYDKEAFQFSVSSQVPAVFRSGELSDRLVGEEDSGVGHAVSLSCF